MTDRSSDSSTPGNPDLTRAQSSRVPGTQTIGSYRLLERVGEGGMGEVWLAEQARPVQRQVALKVIKAGMDTAQVLARFDAERQALALMDHPSIAKVLDGGTTDARQMPTVNDVRGQRTTDQFWQWADFTQAGQLVVAYYDRHEFSQPARLPRAFGTAGGKETEYLRRTNLSYDRESC
jgi:serine/threonine protein kinase